MKVKVSLDPISYIVKPDKQIAEISKRIAGYPVSIDIDELADKVGNQGHTFCPATFMNNKRKAMDFARMQVFTLDFDCGIPAGEVRRQAERCMLPVSFMYHSFSSTSECPRFRTAFVNDVPVTDKKAAEIILSMLLEIFPEADKSCKDVSRMFFGGKGVIGNVQDEVINIENLVEQYQRTCFVKGDKSYRRNIQSFARKNNISCIDNCIQIFKIDKNDGNFASDPYIYRSNCIFPSNSPKYVIITGYKPRTRKQEVKNERVRVDLKTLESKCLLYMDFLKEPHIHHNERFLLMTNMIHMVGGEKRFLSVSDEKGYDRNDWRFYVKYVKDKGYKPQQCEGNCPYCDVCSHKENMVLTVLEKEPIKRTEEEIYYELKYVEEHLYTCLTDAVNSCMNGIHIIPAQTAVGKTEAYCNMIAADKRHRYMIAAPTNALKREIERRLEQKGVKAIVTLSLDEMSLPLDLAKKIEYHYRVGLGRAVARLIKEYIKENENTADNDVMRAVHQCREYLRFEKEMKDFRVVVTTHARLSTFSNENIEKYTVIIDEDILSTFFKNIQMVSLESIQRALEANQIPGLLHSRFRQVVDAADCTYECFLTDSTCSYLEEQDLNMLGIDEDINNLAFAACFQKCGDEVHYFYPQTLPRGKYVVLSATIEPELYYKYFKGWNITTAPYYKAKYKGCLEQRTAYSMSRQCIMGMKQELKQFLDPFKQEYEMITFLKFEKEFEASGLHFGNSEGIDSLKGKNVLVLGTPHLCEFVYKLIGCFLGMEVNHDVLAVRKIQYHGYEFNFMTYKGNGLQKLQLYFINKELEQSIGRARLLRNDCRVLVLSNFPCEQAKLIQDDYLGKKEIIKE